MDDSDVRDLEVGVDEYSESAAKDDRRAEAGDDLAAHLNQPVRVSWCTEVVYATEMTLGDVMSLLNHIRLRRPDEPEPVPAGASIEVVEEMLAQEKAAAFRLLDGANLVEVTAGTCSIEPLEVSDGS